MPVIEQQLSQKPVAADPQTIADFLNRELVPVTRRIRAVLNARLDLAATTFGDGVATVYDIGHPFGTLDVMAAVYDLATGSDVVLAAPVQRLDADTLRVTCAAPPPVDGYRLLVRA